MPGWHRSYLGSESGSVEFGGLGDVWHRNGHVIKPPDLSNAAIGGGTDKNFKKSARNNRLLLSLMYIAFSSISPIWAQLVGGGGGGYKRQLASRRDLRCCKVDYPGSVLVRSSCSQSAWRTRAPWKVVLSRPARELTKLLSHPSASETRRVLARAHVPASE